MMLRIHTPLAIASLILSACAGADGKPGTDGEPAWVDTGCPGPLIGGTCVIGYGNAPASTFLEAALTCASLGGDLCTDSQAWPLAAGNTPTPTLLTGATWLSGFSDNDSGQWTPANGGASDDHAASTDYGYACCGGATPVNPRVPGAAVGDVWTTWIHDAADTTFSGAVGICVSLRSDLCTDSQTFLLRKAGALTVATWTAHHADNDGGMYGAINGGTQDDTNPSLQYGFACCGSTRPASLACPVAEISGVCAVAVHDAADADFDAAATACAAQGADLCSISQSAVLRSLDALSVTVWTNSHSDNDSGNAAVGVGPGMDDNPDLDALHGYACCLN